MQLYNYHVTESKTSGFASISSRLRGNCGKLLQEKLQRFQNRSARVIARANYEIRSAEVVDLLWMNLSFLIKPLITTPS
jgi:hypothetical protein